MCNTLEPSASLGYSDASDFESKIEILDYDISLSWLTELVRLSSTTKSRSLSERFILIDLIIF